MYPKKNKKHKDKLYTLDEARAELRRLEEQDTYFVEFMNEVSKFIDVCENDEENVKKYGKFMIRRR